jgi:hypothetical protein
LTNAPAPSARPGFAPRLRDRIVALRPDLIEYLIIIGVFAVVWTGLLIFRTQYYPDSAHYLGMSLWFSGMSQQDALQVSLERNLANGYEPNRTIEQLFEWGLVKPRVVLPVLAVPFIWVFGPNGLGVLTGLITLVLVLVLYRFLANRYGRLPALAAVLLVLSSQFIMSFSTGMLTESLSALWGVATLAVAYRYQRDARWYWLAGLVLVTALSAFTRQATFIVAGAFVVAAILSFFSASERRKWLWPAVAVAGTALLTQVIQTLLFPFSQADQYMRMTGTDSLWGAIMATPALLKNIVLTDLVSFMLYDQVLLVFVGLALLSMVLFWKRSESHLLFGAILGIGLYNITNGTATQFRYAMPGLVFFVVCVTLLLMRVQTHLAQNRVGTPELRETPSGAARNS